MNKNFYCRGSLGDIIYSLPTVKCLGGGGYYLKKPYYLTILKPLLESLDYISICELVNVNLKFEDIDYNLDAFRGVYRRYRRKEPSKHLVECSLEAFGVEYDRSQPWIYNIDPLYKHDIIINRSPRYHDKEDVDWNSLSSYDCGFIGTVQEHSEFESKFFKLPYIQCQDALEISKTIKGSKLFVGNQSFCFSLAEAMKHPRCLEVCHWVPNCTPSGKDCFSDKELKLAIEKHI